MSRSLVPANGAVSWPSRRAAAALVAVVCVAVAALGVAGTVLTAGHDEVASIDGRTVTRDELLFHMRRLAPTVENELRNEYRLRATIDWDAMAGDETALHRLASRALAEIRRDKVTLVLAKEQGLVDSEDHADFLAKLAEENQRRTHAIAKGETVYGVAEFSPEEYYSHRLAEIRTGLKKRLSANPGGPLQVNDADIRRTFEADREAWSANATTYSYSMLVVRVPAGASPDDVAGLQRRVAAARRLADFAAGEPGAILTTGTYDGNAPASMNAHTQDLIAVLGNLAPGEISAPIPGSGQVTYYELDGKTVDENAAFAMYANRIRQSLVEEKFDQFLQRRVDGSDIEVNAAAVDAINAEDVR